MFSLYFGTERATSNLGDVTYSGQFGAQSSATARSKPPPSRSSLSACSPICRAVLASSASSVFFRGELARTLEPSFVATGSNSQTDFSFGLGLRFYFTHNIGLRAEWQSFIDLDVITDVDLFSIGVQFRF